jgi:hypothetical protein
MQRPDDLLSVYSTDDATDAEIVRAALRGEGLRCEISGENQAGLTGIGGLEIQLLVRAEDFDRARAFLESHRRRR